MRAKTINFERGQDPKKSMKIGHVRDVEELREEYDRIQDLVQKGPYLKFQEEFVDNVMNIIPDRLGGDHGYGNIHMSFSQLTREELYDFDKFIEKYYRKMGLKESVNFERGQEPKKAMGIGRGFKNLTPGTYIRLKRDVSSLMDPYRAGTVFRVQGIELSSSMGEKRVSYAEVNERGQVISGTSNWFIKEDFFNDYFDIVDITNESINFEKGMDPKKSMDIGLGEDKLEVLKALKDLRELGINADSEISEDGMFELNIPGLKDYQVSYLPEAVRDDMWDPEDSWGWGIFDFDNGELIITGKPWEETLEVIKRLLA